MAMLRLLILLSLLLTVEAKKGGEDKPPKPKPPNNPPPSSAPGGSGAGGTTGGATCGVCGEDSEYSEYISNDGKRRMIQSNGCPNHFSGCMKGGFCDGTSSEGTQQAYNVKIPAYPMLSKSSTETKCLTGGIGMLKNGVVVFSQSDGTSACGDAVASESWTFDACGGHATGNGEYHYHSPPACLLDQLGEKTHKHSPFLGWSYDGFPIYGPRGPSGVTMLPCDSDGADATYCLDSCNGLEKDISSIDDFKYRYYLSGPIGDLSCSSTITNSADGDCGNSCCINEVPSTDYNPYTIGCYRGCVWSEIDDGTCDSEGNGFSSSYSPVATTGAMEQHGQHGGVGSMCPTPGPTISPLPSSYPTASDEVRVEVSCTATASSGGSCSLDKKAKRNFRTKLANSSSLLSKGRIGNVEVACARRRLRSGAEKEAEDRGGAEDGPTDRELASSTYSIVFDAYITLTDSGESDSDSVVSSVETELSAAVLASALEATSLFSPGTISVSGSTFVLGTRAPTPAAEAWASTEAPTLAAVMRTTFGTDDGGDDDGDFWNKTWWEWTIGAVLLLSCWVFTAMQAKKRLSSAGGSKVAPRATAAVVEMSATNGNGGGGVGVPVAAAVLAPPPGPGRVKLPPIGKRER